MKIEPIEHKFGKPKPYPITFGDITITAEMVEQAFKRKNGEAE